MVVELWNLIRDWFVQYIWGGVDSNSDFFTTYIGNIHYYQEGGITDANADAMGYEIYFPIGNSYGDFFNGTDPTLPTYFSISLSDWLSTTSTIIVLVLLLVAFGFLVVGIFRLFSRMFALRS